MAVPFIIHIPDKMFTYLRSELDNFVLMNDVSTNKLQEILFISALRALVLFSGQFFLKANKR